MEVDTREDCHASEVDFKHIIKAKKVEVVDDCNMWRFNGLAGGEVKIKEEYVEPSQGDEKDSEPEPQSMVPVEDGMKIISMDGDFLLLTVSPLEHQNGRNKNEAFNPESNKTNVWEDFENVYEVYETEVQFKEPSRYQKRGRNLKCDLLDCANIFQSKSKLEAHRLTHTGEKPYTCREPGCGRIFRQKGHLDHHKMTHSGAKPHKCIEPGCTKAFSRKEHLERHMFMHSGEKPHKCCEPGCSKAFSRNEALIRHKLAHAGVKPHICNEPGCAKAFRTKSDLNVHKRLHSGQKPYQCCQCGKSFSQKSYLKKHVLLHIKKQFQEKPQEMVVNEEGPGSEGVLVSSEEIPVVKLEMETCFQFVKMEMLKEKVTL